MDDHWLRRESEGSGGDAVSVRILQAVIAGFIGGWIGFLLMRWTLKK